MPPSYRTGNGLAASSLTSFRLATPCSHDWGQRKSVISLRRNAVGTNQERPKLWLRPFGVISAFEPFSMAYGQETRRIPRWPARIRTESLRATTVGGFGDYQDP